MNKIEKKIIYFFIILIYGILVRKFLLPKLLDYYHSNNPTVDPVVNIDSGSINNLSTGSVILTGNTGNNQHNSGFIITGYQETDIDYFNKYIKNGNIISYYPAIQPSTIPAGYSYADRSNLLVKYMTENTFQIPKIKPKRGYLYIKLSNKVNAPLFVYRYRNGSSKKVSGDLNLKDKRVIQISEIEYLINLSSIPYKRFYDKENDVYNWLGEINSNKSNYFATAVKLFDGSSIKEIKIARE